MRHLVFLFFGASFFFESAFASLAPRRSSIMVQVSGSGNSLVMDSTAENFSFAGRADILYLVRGGPSFGFHYTAESRNQVGRSESGSAYGAILGFYLQQGSFLAATYDIRATLGNWQDGTGYQGDLGYLEHLGNQFHIGFKFSHRTVVYKKNTQNTAAAERTVTDSFPSLMLTYLF